MSGPAKYDAVVVGCSAGGLAALSSLFEHLPADFPVPVMVVQHRAKDQRDLLEEVLQTKCAIKIKQADEKETIAPGFIYIAPPDYHVLVESDHSLSLSSDAPVRFSRPAIDVLFETAAPVFGPQLVGILLTGASNDGTAGMLKIIKHGGLTIAQDPAEAQYPLMPQSAIRSKAAAKVLSLQEIQTFLLTLCNTPE